MPIALEVREIADGDAGTDSTVRAMLDLIRSGANDPIVIAAARSICADAPSDTAAILALREWCARAWCFRDDPEGIELLYAVETQLMLIHEHGCMPADCDDAAILFGALGAAHGFDLRIVCVAFLTPDAPYTHVWAELRPPTERAPWIEGDVTRDMQAIPIHRIARVAVWNRQGKRSRAYMRAGGDRTIVRDEMATDVGLVASPVCELPSPGLGFTIPILGIDTNDVADVAKIAGSIFGGGKTDPDAFIRARWSKVPANLIRVTGGGGRWTDTLTGETLTDKDTDTRKAAVVASAIGSHVGPDGYWYDDVNIARLSSTDAGNRWVQRFGTADFATAFQNTPQAFQIFGASANLDPLIPGRPYGTFNTAATTGASAPFVPILPAAPSARPASSPGAAPAPIGGTRAAAPAPSTGIPWKTIAIGAGAVGAVALVVSFFRQRPSRR